MTIADRILFFNQSLNISLKLPKDVGVLNPYLNADTFKLCRQFYEKYYHDTRQRKIIIGINPGRLGAGLTGIPFTDPIKLKEKCGIQNDMPKKAELSADFIYHVIQNMGGPLKFFKKYYFTSVSPLGFIKDGKNLNYYDLPDLRDSLGAFIIQSLKTQLEFGFSREVCFCLGEGKNFHYVLRLNEKMKFFNRIIPLPHPRYIMQYKRKQLKKFIDLYTEKLIDTYR